MSQEYMLKTLEGFKNPTVTVSLSWEESIAEHLKFLDSLTLDERMGYDAACFISLVDQYMKEHNIGSYCPYSNNSEERQLVLDELTKRYTFTIENGYWNFIKKLIT